MKLLIDTSVFEVTDKLPAGIITGLYELNRKGVEFGVNGELKNVHLKQIFESENIPIKKAKSGEYLLTCDGGNYFINPGSLCITNFFDVLNVILPARKFSKTRKTKETEITVDVSLDGSGEYDISTGIGFFDHMLTQIARHGNINLKIKCKGDLHVDEHHTVEDTGILLGEVILEALGDKRGIKRYGYMVPMDDCIAVCALDLGGRISLSIKAKFKREKIGDFPVELAEEFFRGLASGLKANIYLKAKGKNEHHKIESLFKAFAKALNEACRIDERAGRNLPSTKGVL